MPFYVTPHEISQKLPRDVICVLVVHAARPTKFDFELTHYFPMKFAYTARQSTRTSTELNFHPADIYVRINYC